MVLDKILILITGGTVYGGDMHMALFIGVHTLKEDMGGGWTGYKKACDDIGIRPVCSYSSSEKGVAYCITEASSVDEVSKAHENAKVPVDDIFEVDYSE